MTGILTARRSRAFVVVLAVVALAASWFLVAAPRAHALNGKVLIIDTAFAADLDFNEATAAESLGLGADVVTAGQWAAMTTADFAQYDAIVLGDNECQEGVSSAVELAAPLANLATWVPAVTGNVFVSTSDAVYHAEHGDNESGAMLQVTKGIGFAAAQGVTGLYFTSSCYGDEAWLGVLDALSPGWSASGDSSDDIHVTGSAAELAGLDDAALVDYGDTVHHLFESWASDFTVYAIATDVEEGTADAANAQNGGGPSATATVDGPYEAQDGTEGAPVILIRGTATSPSHILLQPDTQTLEVAGTAHLTATVTNPNLDDEVSESAISVEGITVTFKAVSGPNAGKTATGVTDSDGNVTIEYSSALAGTDTWEASFVDPNEFTQTSNEVTVEWLAPTPAAAVVVPPRFTG